MDLAARFHGRCRLDRPVAEAPFSRQPVVEPRQVARHDGRIAADDDDAHGLRALNGESTLEQDVALLRRKAGRQCADAVRADVEAEDGGGEGEHRADGYRERERRPPQYADHDPFPEATLRGVGTTKVPAEIRDAP